MTCPIDALPEFDCEHWDVYELCRLMECGTVKMFAHFSARPYSASA